MKISLDLTKDIGLKIHTFSSIIIFVEKSAKNATEARLVILKSSSQESIPITL